jgi:DNA-binding NtrC family response regulator
MAGEAGVGEELCACAARQRSAHAPFVAMSYGAVPGALFEAERFGHARGSFTSADRARAGLVARAEGGSLLHSGARRASDDRERADGDPTLRRHERFAPC